MEEERERERKRKWSLKNLFAVFHSRLYKFHPCPCMFLSMYTVSIYDVAKSLFTSFFTPPVSIFFIQIFY